ncbi:MAG: beta-galactosidase [Phycisphaera sp.]|nr:beta-galactosidase [Phycisphaera sp.]
MAGHRETLSLAGPWAFALDRKNIGIKERWFTRSLDETITLPGSTDEANKGDFVDEQCEDRLSRLWRWIGPAWYQRSVTIDNAWADKKIFLFLERTKDSQVWVDDRWVGSDDSLSTSHVFDLSRHLTPGEHRITLLIDNAKLPPVGPCHQVDERTQTNWNGILGRIELQVCEPIYIQSLQAYPDLTPANVPNPHDDEPINLGLKPGQATIELVAELVNDTKWSGKGGFTFTAEVIGHESQYPIPTVESGTLVKHGKQQVKARLILPAGVPHWDEFNPTLLRITMQSEAMPQTQWVRDSLTITCGLRSFGTSRGQFVVNGRRAHLRGKNDCALFPITGYAPMDKEFWLKFLGTGMDYGLNHYRFHSWTPPEAAFAAADELGIYFQVELPNKRGITHPENRNYTPPAEAYETLEELKGDAGDPATRTAYLTREGERILKQFGNHPSFMMMTLGNEIGGDEEVMRKMTDRFRALDSRHLYAMGTNHFHWILRHRKGDDFWVIKGTREETHIRGASWDKMGHIDFDPPSTTKTYADSLRGVPVPVVAHEMAQFEVYPDYTEIEKYTGVLRPRNLEIFRDRLHQAGMLDQAKDFQRASGLLSVVCRKEDIEAQLRTPGMGGFQLLDIQDFSGQGTALIGILDVFMDSKGLTTPEQWREFCCETVPLLVMKKYTWSNNESFRGRIQVAHYGPRDMLRQQVTWSLQAPEKIIAHGVIEVDKVPTGEVTEIDTFHAPLDQIDTPQQLRLELALPDTPYRNGYDVWVYPSKIDTTPPNNLTVTRQWSSDVEKKLVDGQRVLFLAEPDKLKHTVEMAFQSGFWSPMFRMKGRLCPATGRETPGTQGILLDPDHPLFHEFPTEFHSNWQWWHLVKNSRAMILDDAPQAFLPIIQVIDGFDRNHKLGLLYEAKVGKGRLIVCSIDLHKIQNQPEARQFLSCLYRYASGTDCDPRHTLGENLIRQWLNGV